MFSKKNKETARKVEVKNESPEMREVKINIRPLVRIEQHVLSVNGREGKPQYRISIADRDVLTLSGREYQELFMEMLRHKDNDELIHDIATVHAEEHARAELGMPDLADLKGIAEMFEKSGIGQAIEKALKNQ